MKIFNNHDTKIFALGGLGEVGKNMYCVMHDSEIIIVDAGVMFPQDDLLGIDYVIPDFSYLKKNENKIKIMVSNAFLRQSYKLAMLQRSNTGDSVITTLKVGGSGLRIQRLQILRPLYQRSQILARRIPNVPNTTGNAGSDTRTRSVAPLDVPE